MSILRTEGIIKDYPGTRALDDVTVSFDSGKVHAFIGKNGSGKSTLVKVFAGAIQPTSGHFYLDEEMCIRDSCCPGPDRIYFRHHWRCAFRQAPLQDYRRKNQSAYWFCRRVRSSYGGPCIPEGGSRSRPDQFPADARNGTKRCRRDRHGCSSRYFYGNLWRIKGNFITVFKEDF